MIENGRQAYRCKRCHEWAFLTEADRRAANIMHTDWLDCPYCDTSKGLEPMGFVREGQIVSEYDRAVCNDLCIYARGVECICKCASANHGTGRVLTVTVVHGEVKVALVNAEKALKYKGKVMAQIEEYEKALTDASAAVAQTFADVIARANGTGGRVPYTRYWGHREATKEIARTAKMHSHAGRMKVLAKVVGVMLPKYAMALPISGGTVSPAPLSTEASAQPVQPIQPVTEPMVTERQGSYLRNLIEQRGTAMDAAVDLRSLTMADASRYIKALLAAPFTPRFTQAVTDALSGNAKMPEVKEGRYAIVENGHVAFYRVDKPQDGKWRGYTFLNRVIGGRDRGTAIRALDEKRRIMDAIASDPEALTRFGKEIGSCGHCGRTLTEEESRKHGIGPVCAKYLGMAWA